MQNKKSPYQEGREAYDARTAENQHPKNPHQEFSGKWCEWNRGYNSCWMPSLAAEKAMIPDSERSPRSLEYEGIILHDGLGAFTVKLKRNRS